MAQQDKYEPQYKSICPTDLKGQICGAYARLKKYQCSWPDLQHMYHYAHDAINFTACRHGTRCNAYQRCRCGEGTLEDMCHLEIYNEDFILKKFEAINLNDNKQRNDPININNPQIYYEQQEAYAEEAKLQHSKPYASNNCPYMKNQNQCDAFNRLSAYQYSQQDLQHMQTYTHSAIKPEVCKYGEQCNAYQRLVCGGNELKDLCHLHVKQHPPRIFRRRLNLPEGFNPFTFKDYSNESGVKSGKETIENLQQLTLKYGLKQMSVMSQDQLLQALIKEVQDNQFEEDLYIYSVNDGKKTLTDETLLDIVQQKLEHPRHKLMGLPLNTAEMLALILYTGCDSNYDLCRSQREGDYEKWIVFNYCLQLAILKLAKCEAALIAPHPVFTGLSGVMMEYSNAKYKSGYAYKPGWICTFVSTSWDRIIRKNIYIMV
eukprot:75001_1